MVLWGMRNGTRRLLGRMWTSSFRVKSPRYHVIGEDARDAPYETLWELVNAALPSGLLIGCLVVAGQVAGHVTGPSGIISAVVAGITVSLTGICYAEFRARWPRVNGSPYEYTYLSTGEGLAFLVSAMTLLQDVSMVAAAGRAASQNMDLLLGNTILNSTREALGCVSLVDSCPDAVGAAVVVLVSILVACGVRRKQKLVTMVTNCSVLLVLVFMLIVGLFHLNFALWKTPLNFFPSSYPGVIEGAALSIYAFSLFEIICSKSDFSRQTAGRTGLIAYTLSSMVTVALFMAVTATTTLLVPISQLITETPTPEAFSQAGVHWIKFIICIPSLLTLLVYMWLTLLKIHDLLEAVSLDALLCSQFSNLSERTGTSQVSVIVPAVIATIFTFMFSLTNLLQLASLACLIISTLTCSAAVCIRFRPSILVHSPEHTTHKDRQERRKQRKRQQGHVEVEAVRNGGYGSVTTNNNTEDCPMLVIDSEGEEEHFVGSIDSDMIFTRLRRADNDSDTDIDDAVEEYKEQLRVAALTSCSFMTPNSEAPTDKSARRAAWSLASFVCCLFFIFLILTQGVAQVRAGNVGLIILLVVLLLLLLLLLFILLRQPQDPVSDMDLRISFPLSPWIPLLAIIFNVHLSVHLSGLTWIQTMVVFIIGCLWYFIYGIRNSRASHFYEFLPEEETVLLPEPPRHLVEPQALSCMSRATSSLSCDQSYTLHSAPDVPLVD